MAPRAPLSCKVCGAPAPFWGVSDFNTHCRLPEQPRLLPASGVEVPYHRCIDCGFAFTDFMDAFTGADFRERVYNQDYRLIDPDFEAERPAALARQLLELLGDVPVRVCDYGGGSGSLARHVNSAGRALRAVTWDPFFDAQPRPAGPFELVVSFETFEHAIDPSATLADMLSLTDGNRLVLMSTLCQPANIDTLRTDWWYCAPRNGHVSLHTRPSLDRLADDAGIGVVHLSDLMHLFHDVLPPWIESAIFGSRRLDGA